MIYSLPAVAGRDFLSISFDEKGENPLQLPANDGIISLYIVACRSINIP